ncbi:ATPase, RecA superfamily [Thermococcus kodakarensis KOD1]|uniref:ATPase, RecA superfamily n=1 Tax=Thermococcus kodakarensis (strain ATCC BAA-918 / JCM 12380 / KOD1) TaxID=69014 RepID=Q5JJ74_THEKO|nr:ATPase domain-containing protein [Thermococcus kodakarensis]WCN27698.1 ATPase domain-containing protein [Thermococcus kodakarensis]WCN29991.1 ATPase domain-containing protein [Thermococcus kodakarensis]BAD85978.1 ATPase, RecA superfamily [Thermococcus kodakarensis KOD1]
MTGEWTVPRVKSGIPGFDELVNGGFPKGTTVLVTGPTGSGKTTFAVQFVYKGVELYDEPGVIVTLEERAVDLRREMRAFGWDIEKYEKEGKIAIIDGVSAVVGLPSEEQYVLEGNLNTEDFLRYIYRVVKAIDAKRLVIDSIPSIAFRLKKEEEIREVLLQLNTILLEMGVTSILTTEAPEPSRGKISRYGIEEYIARGVVLLDFIEREVELKRYLLIRKMRETKHSMKKYPFEIMSDGLVVYPSGEIY